MIGYVLEGANPATATEDPRAARLMSAGPWMAQPHPAGAMLTWRSADGVPAGAGAFGPPRKTLDGMSYLPPRALPEFATLANQNLRHREDATDLRLVREEQVIVVRIIPAYASPRKILEDNSSGDFSTRYGVAARKLLDRLDADRSLQYSAYCNELFEVCRLAVMHSHPRVTRELMTDYGILDDDSVFDIWRAIISVPKDESAPGSASSASQPGT